MSFFTVIIATCGRPERLDQVIRCLSESTHRDQVLAEVLVVDNDPALPARRIVELWSARGMPVRHVVSRPRDKAAALNVGIRLAQTDWLAFTDDDCLPDQMWLMEGFRFIKSGRFRIFGGRVVAAQPTLLLPKWLRPGRSGRVPGIGVFVHYDPLTQSGPLGPNDTIPFGANLFAHRDVFKRYGAYDEVLWDLCQGWPLGVEDTEFGYRVRKACEPLGYCRESVVVHPVNHDRGRLGLHLHRAFYEGWRQPLIFFDRDRPWFEPYRVRLIARHIAGGITDAARADLAGTMDHVVEMLRVTGAITGRWSRAYQQWTLIQDQRLAGFPDSRTKERT